MNTSKIFNHGLFILSLFVANSAFSQGNNPTEGDKYYVVVGAFKLEKNVAPFVNSLAEMGLNAQHEFNANRQLHYVYTHSSMDRKATTTNLYAIRDDNQEELEDSWLFYGNFKGSGSSNESLSASKNLEVVKEAEVAKKEEAANAWEELAKGETEDASSAGDNEELVADPEISKVDESGGEEGESEDVSAIEKEIAPVVPLEPGQFRVYLNTTNAKNSREVTGKFSVIDMERNKEHSTVNTQEILLVKPKNGTNRVKFVSGIFGFKSDEHVIDLDEPLKESDSRVEVVGDTILIDFELTRYQKGEFAVLWKVYFYKDAAIMREESVYELNQLLQMLQADDNMKIKIHGHTNGNSKGKVLHLDLDDKEFFSLNGSHNEDVASAKKLSEYRAYTIQHWLMDQGIGEDRMEIIGWGGKKMLHDKHDDQAHQNVRVEIEVLETS